MKKSPTGSHYKPLIILLQSSLRPDQTMETSDLQTINKEEKTELIANRTSHQKKKLQRAPSLHSISHIPNKLSIEGKKAAIRSQKVLEAIETYITEEDRGEIKTKTDRYRTN